MTLFFLECTIRAALIVAASAIILYAMRVKVASIRHRVWTAVLMLMLALPLWIAWGPQAPIRILPANVENFTADFLVETPLANSVQPRKTDTWQATPSEAQPLLSPLEWSFLGLYLFGAFILLARLAIGTLKASRLIRDASTIDDLRISASCAAPVTVGCFRPTILLPKNWPEWSASQLAAVLAHEREHARRRDPLIQWLALFNRAVFWFHPAAWWLERELSALAEECCDAAVLAQGHDPAAYAETLMHMARAVMHSGSRIDVAGTAMPGPRLPQRIHTIFERHSPIRVSRARATLLIAACAIMCVALLAVRFTRAQSGAQDWEKAAGGKQSFDAASVKQNKAGLPPTGPPARGNVPLSDDDGFKPTGGLFRASNLPLTVFISFAYKLNFSQELVLATQATHSTDFKWAIGERWDIDARAPGNPTKNQYRMMMQSLLADRFKLAVHWGTIQGPAYNVELQNSGKLGPQLIPHPGNVPCSNVPKAMESTKEQPVPPCGETMFNSPKPGRSRLSGRAVSMQQIVDRLGVNAPELRPAYDRTGLTGTFDFSMEWATEYRGPTPPGYPEPDATAPSFLDALKDQLGLKLDPVTGPINVLVIDHVEKPTPN